MDYGTMFHQLNLNFEEAISAVEEEAKSVDSTAKKTRSCPA